MNENGLLTLIFPALAFVVLVAVALVIVRKQQAINSEDKALRVLQRLPIGPRECLLVVDLTGERFLLGVTAHQISLLRELPRGVGIDKNGTKVQSVREISDSSCDQV